MLIGPFPFTSITPRGSMTNSGQSQRRLAVVEPMCIYIQGKRGAETQEREMHTRGGLQTGSKLSQAQAFLPIRCLSPAVAWSCSPFWMPRSPALPHTIQQHVGM